MPFVQQTAPVRPVIEHHPTEAAVRRLLTAHADGLLVLGASGVIRHADRRACRLLGRPRGELIGLPFGLPTPSLGSSRIEIRRPGGRLRVADLHAVDVRWQGEPAVLAILRDRTPMLRLRRRIRQLRRVHDENGRRGDHFLAILAHELRSPLGPLLHAVELLRREPDPADGRSRLAVIEQQARTLARLIDDLMDLARGRRDRLPLRREPVAVETPLVRAAAATRAEVEARGQRLIVRPTSAPAWVSGDATWLEVALVHLIRNASKYTESGGTIEVEAAREGDDAVLRVRDDGLGIEPEFLPRLFDLFAQADRTARRAEGGLGIGLAMVRMIAEQHRGRAEAESAGTGRGSVFTLRLPALARPTSAAHACEPAVGICGCARPRRVLVVDDHAAAAEAVVQLLRLRGHEACDARDADEALNLARDFRPDVVLLDVDLAGADGCELAGRLRAEPEAAGARLIALTGYSADDLADRPGVEAFDALLTKPVDGEALERAVCGRD